MSDKLREALRAVDREALPPGPAPEGPHGGRRTPVWVTNETIVRGECADCHWKTLHATWSERQAEAHVKATGHDVVLVTLTTRTCSERGAT